MWPLLLLIAVIGVAAGVGAAWLTGLMVQRSGKSGEELLSSVRMPEMKMPNVQMPELSLGRKPEAAVPAEAELAAMTRKDLESEVKRLHELVYLRDQQLAEMTIQMKLMTDGSRTEAQ